MSANLRRATLSGARRKGTTMQPAAKKDSHPTASAGAVPLKDIRKTLPLRVLTPADWDHWISRGYVILRQAVPAANVDRLVDVLWAFDEKDPDDPATWYAPQRRDHKMAELNNAGMLEIYNHQTLWDNRMAPRVYDALSISGTAKIFGSPSTGPT